jgi:hypothetical protein
LKTTPPDTIKLRRRTSECIILGGAVLLGLCAIVVLRPALSEDVLRYRMDGRMWLSGTSPYATPPIDWSGKDAVDAMTPFARLTTIYPPASQMLFAAVAAIERLDGQDAAVSREFDRSRPARPNSATPLVPWRAHLASPGRVYAATTLRTVFAACGIGCTLLLLLMMRQCQASPWWAALLAWNPLFVLETAGMGHQDAAGAALLLLGLYLLGRRSWIGCGAALALAAAVKPLALFVFPFALRDAVDGRRRLLAAMIVASAALYLPALSFQNGLAGWERTARAYSSKWEFNGSMYETLKATFGAGDEGRAMARAKQMSRLIGVGILLVALLGAWQLRASPARAGYIMCLAALLVSPVVYPWYVLWPLCFVPLLRGSAGWSALAWSATASVSYIVWHQRHWHLSGAAMAAEYLPVYLTAGWELGTALWRLRTCGRGGISCDTIHGTCRSTAASAAPL